MLNKTIKSLKESPIIKKGEYSYMINGICDGINEIHPEILNEMTNTILENIKVDVNKIVAIEAMGIHLGTALSLKTGIPLVIIRKRKYGLENEVEVVKQTGYEESKLYINNINKNDKILIIDDIVSTGGTLIKVIDAIKKIGTEIEEVICIIDKGKGQNIVEKETGIKLFTLISLEIINDEVVITRTIDD